MTSFPQARAMIGQISALQPRSMPLTEAIGAILAADVCAPTPLPPVATSAMDGWALGPPDPGSPEVEQPAAGWAATSSFEGAAGRLSWRIMAAAPASAEEPLPALGAGEAAGVLTGSPVPAGIHSVLRSEHVHSFSGDVLSAEAASRDVAEGANIRLAGTEAQTGDVLIPAGQRLTPVRAAAAAAAGLDTVTVVPRARVQVITTGEEIITEGIPGPGQVRDTFGMSLPQLVASWGSEEAPQWIQSGDDPAELSRILAASTADIIITTGGTAHSEADPVRAALESHRADMLIDHVQMRPGHPALLAQLPGGPYVLGLPGNPLAGFTALLALGAPLVAARSGAAPWAHQCAGRIQTPMPAPGPNHRLMPVRRSSGTPSYSDPSQTGRVQTNPSQVDTTKMGAVQVEPVDYIRPHMLRGIAAAQALAIIPPEGTEPGDEVTLLPIPGQY